jgi:hypothetical protein
MGRPLGQDKRFLQIKGLGTVDHSWRKAKEEILCYKPPPKGAAAG